ncbi:hypothetical protein [Falsiroseomonas oryziterrae]|uniref:hypothetical protein n=1 Tax=Falsiroseomonas oryziterrae TaxID=2911368 RepID=UPI001F403F06|nr:hypothetical protein [Roseomonas sp. NPKOSM-4]
MHDNAKQNRDDPPPSPPGEGATQPNAAEAAFDLWLNRSLHQLYDGVAAEPVPPELLRLIETDRGRRGK